MLEIQLLIVEGDAELRLEAVGLDPVEHAEALEDGHAVGHERLAHAEAGEGLALCDGHGQPSAREERGGGGAAGPPAHHEHVVVGARHRSRHATTSAAAA